MLLLIQVQLLKIPFIMAGHLLFRAITRKVSVIGCVCMYIRRIFVFSLDGGCYEQRIPTVSVCVVMAVMAVGHRN